ncbi:helix-turn-helix domain-containing protein [Streptomyces sp. enrichment culture]|uniref:AraC-like ligand-binding domain-containing protein n=1 Tax=Streptomyces sp. enrichment culture TaxID=1795815 RepID=UPI003F545EA5
MSVVLSTAELSAADRSERWHEAVSQAFVPLNINILEEDPSPGRIVTHRLGAMQISDVQAGSQEVTRSKRLIARDGKEYLILTLQHRGSAVKEQDGRECLIEPGSFSISDSSRPFRKKVKSKFHFTSFHFPRKELRVRDEDLHALTARAFSSHDGSAALVAAYFAQMAREGAAFDEVIGRQFVATGLDLLALFFDEQRGRFRPQPPETATAMVVRVKDHILQNLSDPDLSPTTIAAAHFISVRYLHKLFQLEATTVGEWIRAERLERCRRDLLRSPALGLGVATIARRWGFVSPSHFSRVFRAAYGVAPRDWQARGLSCERRTDE